MVLDKKMLAILVCPLCKGNLEYIKQTSETQAAASQGVESHDVESQAAANLNANSEADNPKASQSGKKAAAEELTCKVCRLAFPIQDDIPIMLESAARRLPLA